MSYLVLLVIVVLLYIMIGDKTILLRETSLLNKKKDITNLIVLLLAFVPMVLIAGFRSADIGTDTKTYITIYRDLYNYNGDLIKLINNTVQYRKNPGWTILFKFISDIFGDSPRVYILCSSLIIYLLFMIGLYFYHKNIKHGVIVFLLYFYLPSLNGMRIFIAFGFVFLGIVCKLNKKSLISLLLIFIAFTIHKTAIIGFFIWIIMSVEWNERRFLSYSTVGSVILLILLPLFIKYFANFFGDYSHYLTDKSSGFSVGGKSVVYQIFFISLLIYGWEVLKTYPAIDSNEKKYIYSLMVLNVTEIIIAFAGFQSWYLLRIKNYFAISSLLLLPTLSQYKVKHKNLLLFVGYAILLFGFIYTIVGNYGNVLY